MCIKYSKQLWVSLSSLEENHSSFKAWNVCRNYYHMFNLYQHIDQWMYNPVWFTPLVFDNIKSKYKQKANLSNTKVLRWRTIVALQKIHEGKIKLTIIKLQLKLKNTKRCLPTILSVLQEKLGLKQWNSQNSDEFKRIHIGYMTVMMTTYHWK